MKKTIQHAEFARRLQGAVDLNPDVPPKQHGRLGWFVDKLAQHGIEVTAESVRRWFEGETYPRPKAMLALAQILNLDHGWLVSGKSPEFSERQQRQHSAVANGAINVVAGFVQMDGGFPAFPGDDDRDAVQRNINLYAIIKGAKYNFHVLPATRPEQSAPYFLVPQNAGQNVILGVDRYDHFCVTIHELDWETVEREGERYGNGFRVPVDGSWRIVTTFAERI